jgi:hypothetical protein
VVILPLWIKNWGLFCLSQQFVSLLSSCLSHDSFPCCKCDSCWSGALSPSSHLIYDLFIHIDCKLLLLLFINLSLIICILNFIYYRAVPSLFNPSWPIVFFFFFFFFFDLRGVSGPAYAYHDYSPRPTGHPASPGAGKAPRGWQACT